MSKSICAWYSVFWKVINYRFNLPNRYRLIRIVYFLLCEFWQIMSSKELVHFNQVISFVGLELFMEFFYYPLIDMGYVVMPHLSFLICPLFFCQLVCQEADQLIAISEEQAFGFIDFLYWFLIFNFIDFCSNSSYYFLLLFLNLICSSLSSFLQQILRLFILNFSLLLIYAIKTINFPLSTAFIVSHKLYTLCFHHQLVQNILKFLLRFILRLLCYLEVLFNFHIVFNYLPDIDFQFNFIVV